MHMVLLSFGDRNVLEEFNVDVLEEFNEVED